MSNRFVEYTPVYSVAFGCNHPPRFSRPPGGSEEDRIIVLYMPNKFCDEKELTKHPKSPRRFKKLDIDSRARSKEAGWALLQILLSVRRAIPDLDAFVASGSPTSNDSPKSGVVWGGSPLSPRPNM